MKHDTKSLAVDFDVVIVGAGISGINSAYRLQTQLPGRSYTILEARDRVGGTWDLFRYPGIRSDSDLYTFGFSWLPWIQASPIASGPSILQYIKGAAAKFGIDRHIQFNHKLDSANWCSEKHVWQLVVNNGGEERHLNAKFIVLGTGYYDYDEPLAVDIPGLSNFEGQVVHPQFWPEDLSYDDKKVVVIGSGATAITLLPNLAKKASSVTMLQRSPSYVLSVPSPASKTWIQRYLPVWIAYNLRRLRFLIFPVLFFKWCRAFPTASRRFFRKQTMKELPSSLDHSTHFQPTYDPWDQRLCVCPNGDFFQCLRDGNASVSTGRIKTVAPKSIVLESGQELEADIIITATGLKLRVGGGTSFTIDDKPTNLADKFAWRSAMLQDIPNCAMIMGYVNASWTLGADATIQLFYRLIRHMESHGISSAVPKTNPSEKLTPLPLLDLKSTYVVKATSDFPKAAQLTPWKAHDNYLSDYIFAKFGNFKRGLEFSKIQD